MTQRAHVAGSGIISAIGTTRAETFNALQGGISGIGSLTLFDSVYKELLPVGEVKMSNAELSYRVGSSGDVSRTALLGMHAAKEAYLNSGIRNMNYWRTGLISATTVGGMDKTENFFQSFLNDTRKGRLREVVSHDCGRSTELIAESLGIKEFISTINTACSSSVNAIMLAARLIKNNKLDVVFAGGTDALTRFTLNGFNSLMILDKNPCRPFDASRSGLNLGEGSGYVVLVSDRVLEEEEIQPIAYVSGFANTNDAFHQTASSPDGRGSCAAMQQALHKAGLRAEDIGYINLHGTGTINNDLSEGNAIKRVFENNIPPLSSTKSFTGHTLGACGGIEAVISLLSITNQCVFPNLRFEQPMPEVGIVPQKELAPASINHVMSNSFGFGGNCSSIIFSKSEIRRQ